VRDPVLLIANPGSRRGARLQRKAIDAFREAGVRCDVVITEGPGHGGRVCAERAEHYQAVFTLGGDGTAIEAIEALRATAVPVGILAGGTGNLLALSLGIPVTIARAVPALLAGDEARVDLGVLSNSTGTRRFAITAGVGVDAQMIHETPAALKRRFGVLAYAAAATRALLRRRPFRVTVEAEGESIEREAVAVMVANFGAVLRNLLWLGPGIREDDGLLDLCVFCPRSSLDGLRLAWRLMRKDFRPDPAMVYRAGRRFRISCTPDQVLQADGEMRGRSPFEVSVDPLAARLLVPRGMRRVRPRAGESRPY
jgi:YegS/Rv2252/BmrU family lipid kinase